MSHLKYFDYEGFGEMARKEIHYSQAARHGDIIEISGQGGLDRISYEFPKDLDTQIDKAFSNVEHTLLKAGGKGWEQVYKVHCYCTPYNDAFNAAITRNLRKYCPNHQPLLTVLGVEKLALEGMHIEVEVAAHLGA